MKPCPPRPSTVEGVGLAFFAVEIIEHDVDLNTPLTVESHVLLRGRALAGAHVTEGGLFEMRGVVRGGITVAPGGRLLLYGMSSGDITNDGEADIYGVIQAGDLGGSGATRVSEDVIASGWRRGDLPFPLAPPLPETGELTSSIMIWDDGRPELHVVGGERHHDPITVDGQLVITGAAMAGVHVLADGWLQVKGAVFGGITVDRGGHLALTGACSGGLANDGEADVYGAVIGGVSGTGQTRVAPDANVDGIEGSDLGWEAPRPT